MNQTKYTEQWHSRNKPSDGENQWFLRDEKQWRWLQALPWLTAWRKFASWGGEGKFRCLWLERIQLGVWRYWLTAWCTRKRLPRDKLYICSFPQVFRWGLIQHLCVRELPEANARTVQKNYSKQHLEITQNRRAVPFQQSEREAWSFRGHWIKS